jgi:hypothetical protein
MKSYPCHFGGHGTAQAAYRWRDRPRRPEAPRCHPTAEANRNRLNINDCWWDTSVVSLSEQVMRLPSDLSAFLKLPAVSPRERQQVQAHNEFDAKLPISFSNFSPKQMSPWQYLGFFFSTAIGPDCKP